MLVNWNLLVSAVKLVSFERVTCSFVGVTCSFVSVTCSFVGVTCSFDAITFRFVIPKWWILQHIYSGENSVEKGGGGGEALWIFEIFVLICILQLFAFKHKPQTFSRVCLRFITWRLPFETEAIQMRKYIC